MVTKVWRYLIATLLLMLVLPMQAQQFFNLTADEVRVDSVLPRFVYSKPLSNHYQDSIYTATIKYAEYVDTNLYIDNKHKLNMKQRRTSLKDLADRLGVSIATVSRALRNSHEVGEEMTQKVKSLAKELNYRPNPFAQSLRKEAPRVIGVIVPNLVTHYYAAVLDGIEDYAVRNGY